MRNGWRGRRRERDAGVAQACRGGAAPAREGQPWWQGSWQALGGLFNLLAALAARWPKQGS